jgi:hypothetical protein
VGASAVPPHGRDFRTITPPCHIDYLLSGSLPAPIILSTHISFAAHHLATFYTMNKLPPEILAHIIASGLDEDGNLAQYSTISRAWKASIERLTFRRLTITTDELDEFVALFDGDNVPRRTHLTNLDFQFILPFPPNADGCCIVTQPPDRHADSIEFSASLAKLFTALSDIAARSNQCSPLNLSFWDFYWRDKVYGMAGKAKRCRGVDGSDKDPHTNRQVREAYASSGQFELVRQDLIPALHGITSVDFGGYDAFEDLKPMWVPDTMSRLPDLEKVAITSMCDLYSHGRRKRYRRRECKSLESFTHHTSILTNTAFLRSILRFESDHLREIRLYIYRCPLRNESVAVHNFVKNGNRRQESWFRMLKHFASFQNLAILQLQGGLVVCPDFFRSIMDYSGTPFPSLTEFELQFAPEKADGRWFYERDEALERSRTDPKWEKYWEDHTREEEICRNGFDPRSLHDTDSDNFVRIYGNGPFRKGLTKRDRFRSKPSAETFLPFLLNASKAIKRMPGLSKFILQLGCPPAERTDMDHWRIVSRVFELWYLKSGMRRAISNTPIGSNPRIPGDAKYLNRNRLYWRLDGTVIWDDVHEAWGAIAGPDAKVVYLDEDQWEILRGGNPFYIYNGDI